MFILILLLGVISGCDSDVKEVGFEDEDNEKTQNLGVTEEVAKECGGFYILSNNSFYPLQEAGEVFGNTLSNLVFTDPEKEDIPVMKPGDKLVLFRKDRVADHYVAIPVKETGYTIPVAFSNPTELGSGNKVFLEIIEIPMFNQKITTIGEKETIKVESVNGELYSRFFENKVFNNKSFCSAMEGEFVHIGCGALDQTYYADLNEGESVKISYYEGTEYTEIEKNADIKYYAFDGCKKSNEYAVLGDYTGINMNVLLSQNSYALLNTDTIDSGLYIITLDDLKDNSYLSNDDYKRYIFKVL